MSRKIILFLSSYQEAKAKEVVFSCPSGLEVSGKQTNEAPVKYLLYTYPDISEILCVVTPDAERTALPYFQEVIKTISPEIVVTSVVFQEEDDFNKTALLEVVQKINAHDEILLETTGGFRNAAMYLVLVSRVLSYNGSKTIAAVYANLQKKRIEDVFEILNMFDLIGGMQELSSLFYTEDTTVFAKCLYKEQSHVLKCIHKRDIFEAMLSDYLDFYMSDTCKNLEDVAYTKLKCYEEIIPNALPDQIGKEIPSERKIPAEVSIQYLAVCKKEKVSVSARSNQKKDYDAEKKAIWQ